MGSQDSHGALIPDAPATPGQQVLRELSKEPAVAEPPAVLDRFANAAKEWLGLQEVSLEYAYDDLAAATDNFDPKRRLGAGAAGQVYSGRLVGGTEVAIKVLIDTGAHDGFVDEVRHLSRLRHPNIVTLFGFGQKGKQKYLVYEVLDGGDVQVKLKKCKGTDTASFAWDHRMRVALDSARGLSHMVNNKETAFHRDIKSANILLNSDGTAKIADFGLATLVAEREEQDGAKGPAASPARKQFSVQRKNMMGTPGYACPTYALTGLVSEESEVYSFGIVLLELLVNRPPCLMGPEGDLIYPVLQAVQPTAPGAHERLLGNLDPLAGWPEGEVVEDFADLALSCVDLHPERRPSFQTVVRGLYRLCKISGAASSGGASPD